jgi:hypothetical protein
MKLLLRRRRWFAAVCFALLALGCLPEGRAWQLNEFFIYLWYAPDGPDPETNAKALAEAAFTVVDWDQAKLDVLQRHGLKAMVHGAFSEDLARKLAGETNIWGYHLGDEPYPEDKFPPIAEQFRIVERVAPNHVPFINMLSTTGDFLRSYMDVVRPSLLSFDYYQWWWGMDRYFEKLEQFRETALGARVPLAACFEVSANPAADRGDMTYLPDNLAKLRQSIYTTLAYGAKGIEWFSARMLFEPKSAILTPAGRDVATLNREIKRIGPVLLGLRSIDVFHTPPLPAATRTPPKDYWLHVLAEDGRPGLVQGMFKDEQGRDYLLVANRDYRNAQAVNVRLQSKWRGIAPWNKPKTYSYSIEQLNKASLAWKSVSSSSISGFNFVIGAGDGELFRIVTKVTE